MIVLIILTPTMYCWLLLLLTGSVLRGSHMFMKNNDLVGVRSCTSSTVLILGKQLDAAQPHGTERRCLDMLFILHGFPKKHEAKHPSNAGWLYLDCFLYQNLLTVMILDICSQWRFAMHAYNEVNGGVFVAQSGETDSGSPAGEWSMKTRSSSGSSECEGRKEQS